MDEVVNVLVMCQRKVGNKTNQTDFDRVEQDVQLIETYVQNKFKTTCTCSYSIEYLSEMEGTHGGIVDYNFTFGRMERDITRRNTKTARFVKKNNNKYDLIILYSAPYVCFVQDKIIRDALHELLKPNGFVSLYHCHDSCIVWVKTQNSQFVNFDAWHQRFQPCSSERGNCFI
jgi:hypothetical protein